MRLGLCCLFRAQPIHYRTTTARVLKGLGPRAREKKLSALCLENAVALVRSLETVCALGIGGFRVSSQLFPRLTHPEVGYRIEELTAAGEIFAQLEAARQLATRQGLRLSFHPDPFITLSSSRPDVTESSRLELEHHGALAERIGADVITLHAGGSQGGKSAALARLYHHLGVVSPAVRSRLALENDDHVFTPRDLLPLCERAGLPLVYDVHHHRCNPDLLSIDETTTLAATTWTAAGREPLLHVSSPQGGWRAADPRQHADYVDVSDFPSSWRELPALVDVEARAKELAVLQLARELGLTLPVSPPDRCRSPAPAPPVVAPPSPGRRGQGRGQGQGQGQGRARPGRAARAPRSGGAASARRGSAGEGGAAAPRRGRSGSRE